MKEVCIWVKARVAVVEASATSGGGWRVTAARWLRALAARIDGEDAFLISVETSPPIGIEGRNACIKAAGKALAVAVRSEVDIAGIEAHLQRTRPDLYTDAVCVAPRSKAGAP